MVTSANGTELSFAAYILERLATKYRTLDDQYENVKESMLYNEEYSTYPCTIWKYDNLSLFYQHFHGKYRPTYYSSYK
ncbi:hypothetical protein CsatB_024744 [Cannabis sativa]